MSIIFRLFLVYSIYFASIAEGLHIKYVANIPYYVQAPSLDTSFSAKIQNAEDISEITYTNEERIQFENKEFKYSIDVNKKSFRGWLRISNYATVRNNGEYEGSARSVDVFIDMFRKEAFGKTETESESALNSSVMMFLLLNRHESLSNAINEQLFSTAYYVNGGNNIFVNIGLWQPKWVTGVGRNICAVPIDEVRQYFLKLLKYDADNIRNGIDSNVAIEFLQQNEVSKLRRCNHVPYRELREALRVDCRKMPAFNILNSDGNSIIYECMHDSDITSLRVPTKGSDLPPIGLYSYYSMLIQQHENPDLLTTGYCANLQHKPQQISVELMNIIASEVDKDILCGDIASKVDPRLVYIPEPNFIVKAGIIDNIQTIMHYSFLENLRDWSIDGNAYSFEPYDPHESSVLLANMYNQLDRKPVIIFDSKHPVEIELPDRMFRPKRKKDAYFARARQISPTNLSQHFLCFRDSAMIAYRQLGLIGSLYFNKGNAVFTSVFCTIFNGQTNFKTNLSDNRVNDMLSKANGIARVEDKVEYLQMKFFDHYNHPLHMDNLAYILFSAVTNVKNALN